MTFTSCNRRWIISLRWRMLNGSNVLNRDGLNRATETQVIFMLGPPIIGRQTTLLKSEMNQATNGLLLGSLGVFFSQYFQQLFTTSGGLEVEGVLEAVSHNVTPKMNAALLRPFQQEELKEALFQM
jgi:hypothetical protein